MKFELIHIHTGTTQMTLQKLHHQVTLFLETSNLVQIANRKNILKNFEVVLRIQKNLYKHKQLDKLGKLQEALATNHKFFYQ